MKKKNNECQKWSRLIGISFACLASLCLLACKATEEKEQGQTIFETFLEQKQQYEKELSAIREEVKDNFYFQQLATEEEKRLYLQVVKGMKGLETSIKIGDIDAEGMTRAYLSVANDFPEFYWMSGATADGVTYTDIESPVYPSDVEAVSQDLEQIADTIVSQDPAGSDYDKVKYFYEYIIQQTDYDVAALQSENIYWRSQEITSVFLDKKSVCAGYSRAFQYLCQKAGIDCIYVTGKATAAQQNTIGHAWNLVKIGDRYYGVDTTWGDPVFDQAMGSQLQTDISYNYLCVTDEFLQRSRVVDKDLLDYWGEGNYQASPIHYPVCDDNSLNYYLQKGAYFAQYDQATILQAISDQVAGGNSKVLLQFANPDSLQQMLALVSQENNPVFDALGSVNEYQYYYDDISYTFELLDWR